MASYYKRQLEPTALTADFAQRDEDVTDFGAYNTLDVHCRVLTTGTLGNVSLEHSATGEPDSWVALSGATWDLTTAGGFVHVTGFLRFIRAVTNGTVAGSPVALIDAIGKQ